MRKALWGFVAAGLLCSGSIQSVFASAPSPSPSPGSSSSQLQQAEQQKQLLEQVQSKLGETMAEAVTAQEQLTFSIQENTKSQQQVTARVNAAQARFNALQAQVAKLNAQIQSTEANISIERRQLRALARAIYTQPGSVLLMLAEVSNLGQLVTQISDLASAGGRASALKQRLQAEATTLRRDRTQMVAEETEAAAQKAMLAADLAKLQSLAAAQQVAIRQLQDKISQTKAEMASVKNQSTQLASEIAALIQEQQDDIIAGGYSDIWAQVKIWQEANPLTGFPESPGHSKKYRFIWPEPNAVITQPFGPTDVTLEPPYDGFPHFHTGIDLAEPLGSPVFAADDGVVALVGYDAYGYGNYVILAHSGGLVTLYGHLEKALVTVGQKVVQGQPIGLEGSTGNSTGPHCHFELRINGVPIDPTVYLPPGPPSAFKG